MGLVALVGWYNRLMTTPDPEPVDLSKLRPGPIRHESLPPELLEHIEAIHDVVGPYLDTTLEQFEIGFMRDTHPENEVVVWCSITAAWIAYHEKYLGDKMLPDEEEKGLLGALIAISTGVDDVEKLRVSADVGRKLLACYAQLGQEWSMDQKTVRKLEKEIEEAVAEVVWDCGTNHCCHHSRRCTWWRKRLSPSTKQRLRITVSDDLANEHFPNCGTR
jgi:hypothetical protein